ncbi:MAG: PucR family transcriptional regulator [Chloroflexota bacterium]
MSESRRTARLLLQQDSPENQQAAATVLGPLQRYDRTHGGDLVNTLRVYLEEGCNASRAASTLYLHRSGLLYRLRRIEELLGMNLNCYEDRLGLQIALLAFGSDVRGE